MTTIEIEAKLSELFSHGEILTREVRLTHEEAAQLQDKGTVLLSPLAGDRREESSRLWYTIEFKGAFAG
ncbi:MAG: hypothetical protein RR216_02920 [Pseudoflavonifractor sp.]